MPFDPSNIDAESFLESLEIRNISKATADEFRFSCPFPNHTNGDENASAYMNMETTSWYCHGCHEKGNAVTFAAAYLGVSPIEATRLLREVYQPGYINPEARNTVDEMTRIFAGKKTEQVVEQPQLDEDVLERFDVDWFKVEKAINDGDDTFGLGYMIQRGFGPEVLTEWRIGFDQISRRITIPVRDAEGTLIGFKARSTDTDRHPKYLVLGDRPGKRERYGFPCYQVSRVVFGLDRATKMDRHLIVSEGELNAIAVQAAGFPGAAINGSQFSQSQADLLRYHADAVTLFFDWWKRDREGNRVPDDAGRSVTWRVLSELAPFMPVRVVHDHEGDPASMKMDQIKTAVQEAEGSTRFAVLHNP